MKTSREAEGRHRAMKTSREAEGRHRAMREYGEV
jgi:hypothetical protein